MKHLLICGWAFVAAATLSACGSGGGASSFDASEAITLTNSTAPTETVADQGERAAAILDRVNAMTVSSMFGESNDPELPIITASSDCVGTTCEFIVPQIDPRNPIFSITLDDILLSEGRVDTLRAVLTKKAPSEGFFVEPR